MAPRIRRRKPRGKRREQVTSIDGYYPGEVARILGLERIDYRQLRAILAMARRVRPGGQAPASGKWSRFDFRDLCAARAVVDIFGGPDRLGTGRVRLLLRSLERTCSDLQMRYGIEDPLLQVKLVREEQGFVAQADGIRFEPSTGQVLINTTYQAAKKDGRGKGRDFLAMLECERTRLAKRVSRPTDVPHSEVRL